MNPAEVLRAAAKEVEKGWTQGIEEDVHGNVCSVGAIARVFRRQTRCRGVWMLPDFDVCCCVLSKVYLEVYGSRSISHTNDELIRDKSEVIACMEKAAAQWEEKA